MTNYAAYLSRELIKYEKFTMKKPMFDNFYKVFKNIMQLYNDYKFKAVLPKPVHEVYFYMLNDDNYLRTLEPKEITYLLSYNSSPKLLGFTIKVSIYK